MAAVCATGSRPTQFTVVVPCMSWSHVNWPARTQCTRLFTFIDGRNKRLYDCLWSVDNNLTNQQLSNATRHYQQVTREKRSSELLQVEYAEMTS